MFFCLFESFCLNQKKISCPTEVIIITCYSRIPNDCAEAWCAAQRKPGTGRTLVRSLEGHAPPLRNGEGEGGHVQAERLLGLGHCAHGISHEASNSPYFSDGKTGPRRALSWIPRPGLPGACRRDDVTELLTQALPGPLASSDSPVPGFSFP